MSIERQLLAATVGAAMMGAPEPAEAANYGIDAGRAETHVQVTGELKDVNPGSFALTTGYARAFVESGARSHFYLDSGHPATIQIIGPVKELPLVFNPVKIAEDSLAEEFRGDKVKSGYNLEITIDGITFIQSNTLSGLKPDTIIIKDLLKPGLHTITINLVSTTGKFNMFTVDFPDFLTQMATVPDHAVFTVIKPDTFPLPETFPPQSRPFVCGAKSRGDSLVIKDSDTSLDEVGLLHSSVFRAKVVTGPDGHPDNRARVWVRHDTTVGPDGNRISYEIVPAPGVGSSLDGIPLVDDASKPDQEYCAARRVSPRAVPLPRAGQVSFKANVAVAPAQDLVTPFLDGTPDAAQGGPEEPMHCVMIAKRRPADGALATPAQGTLYCHGLTSRQDYAAAVRPGMPVSSETCVTDIGTKMGTGDYDIQGVCTAGELRMVQLTFEKVGVK